jgi:hypothetical protein
MKRRYERISDDCAAAVSKRMGTARAIRRKLLANGELDSAEVRAFSEGTINDKSELFAPGAFFRNFRISGILKLLVRQMFGRTHAEARRRGGDRRLGLKPT